MFLRTVKLCVLASTTLICLSQANAVPTGYADPAGKLWFSWGGDFADMNCLSVNEPGTYGWGDNYLCFPRSVTTNNLKWSVTGRIPNMYCSLVNEPGTYGWGDNYLCSDEPGNYGFEFSPTGPIYGKNCVSMFDGAVGGWQDNYLCYTPGTL